MIGHAIGVPANDVLGIDRGTAANVDALMKVITDPTLAEQAIGIISADYYDADRANLKALAFKADEQECAYLPDSTAFKKDKQNVRDGHYPIWGPLALLRRRQRRRARVGRRAGVRLGRLGAELPTGAARRVHRVEPRPVVRHEVQRSAELGPLSPYSPPFQCGCYFEASPAVNGAAPGGMHALRHGQRLHRPGAPACNLGYCEVQ